MTTLAIELHDVATLARAAGEAKPRAVIPGIVCLDGQRLLVGDDAKARRRILPRSVHDSFWHALSTETLGAPFEPTWTLADLAHAHLELLWQQSAHGMQEVILAVNGDLEGRRLALALAVARSLEIPVRGVVSAPLAAALSFDPSPRQDSIHVELTRHTALVTPLMARHGRLIAEPSRRSSATGRLRLQDRFVVAIAEAFMRATRFDPLHRSAHEQQLVDRLPRWLETLKTEAKVVASLDVGGAEPMSLEISGAELRQAISNELASLLDLIGSGDEPILLSHHAAATPGFQAALETAGRRVFCLPPGAAVEGALGQLPEVMTGDPPLHVLSLPIASTELEDGGFDSQEIAQESATPQQVSEPRLAATHVLIADVAHRLESKPLVLGTHANPCEDGEHGLSLAEAFNLDTTAHELAGVSRRHLSLSLNADTGDVRVEDHSRYGTWLDDRRLDKVATAASGVKIRLGPTSPLELRLIRVVS